MTDAQAKSPRRPNTAKAPAVSFREEGLCLGQRPYQEGSRFVLLLLRGRGLRSVLLKASKGKASQQQALGEPFLRWQLLCQELPRSRSSADAPLLRVQQSESIASFPLILQDWQRSVHGWAALEALSQLAPFLESESVQVYDWLLHQLEALNTPQPEGHEAESPSLWLLKTLLPWLDWAGLAWDWAALWGEAQQEFPTASALCLHLQTQQLQASRPFQESARFAPISTGTLQLLATLQQQQTPSPTVATYALRALRFLCHWFEFSQHRCLLKPASLSYLGAEMPSLSPPA